VDVEPEVALPAARATGAPKFTPSMVNCTVPDGVARVVLPVTVAVKLTPCPKTDGLTDDVTLVVVLALLTARGSQLLVAGLLLASPLKVAEKP
jgi:hypothetical protein